jgi:FKBP-type peptidyl-prolyl cis-trans isomerase SlyD
MSQAIENNAVVSIHYELSDDAGNAIESSRGQEPMSYLHGNQNLIPGLENALAGRVVGDTLKVTVEPKDAYGEVDDDLVQVVPMAAFQGIDNIEPGMSFQATGPDGQASQVVVAAVEGEDVTVDGNHQLAGVTLVFDVEVMDVREASEEEIAHGHAH